MSRYVDLVAFEYQLFPTVQAERSNLPTGSREVLPIIVFIYLGRMQQKGNTKPEFQPEKS